MSLLLFMLYFSIVLLTLAFLLSIIDACMQQSIDNDDTCPPILHPASASEDNPLPPGIPKIPLGILNEPYIRWFTTARHSFYTDNSRADSPFEVEEGDDGVSLESKTTHDSATQTDSHKVA